MNKRILKCYLQLAAVSAVVVLFGCAAFWLICEFFKPSGVAVAILALIFAAAAGFIIYIAARCFDKHTFFYITEFLRENNFEGEDIFSLINSLYGKIGEQDREIKRQLGRVEKEKNRLSTIINNMDEGLIILDNDLRVIMLNDSAYSWLGSSVEKNECPGKPIAEVCVSEEICACIERADSVNLTLDGRHLQLHVNHVVSNTEQVGRIGLLLDVTERQVGS